MSNRTTDQVKKDCCPLSEKELTLIDGYWRAANYLSVGQIYLLDNPLLSEPLSLKHIKPRLLGHWGTTPGLNFIYVHLNRVIKLYDLNMILLAGPGHGAPGLIANTYLEGSYTEKYPSITQDADGMRALFKQFSFPGGIPSHAAAETPGSIHEGGELGYVLTHGYGAVFDNPDLIACCVIGDGEAETATLAASWHSNKFLCPNTDGAVLPILHLNGYKIANPTILSRIDQKELESLLIGYGYTPYFVEGDDPLTMHQKMAKTLEIAIEQIHALQKKARSMGTKTYPRWPVIVLKTPKGWTCPKQIDGKQIEGSWRSHQVPITEFSSKPQHIALLEKWMKSYEPQELFDASGKLKSCYADLAPKGLKRLGDNPHANGGIFLKDLHMPNFKDHSISVSPGITKAENATILGFFLRDVMKLNKESKNFRVMGPDETSSNRLDAIFEVTNRTFEAEIFPEDNHLSNDGRVMEVLSENLCQGWLEGYLLTGRHGFFSCYEAFIHIVDAMFNQHAKWLKVAKSVAWRRPIASLNYFLTSHVWRQDHNGFSHQDPGFLDLVVNKKASIIRIYLPPDANTLLSVADHCLRSRNYINVIVAGKHSSFQYLAIDDAAKHCEKGLGIWKWASNDQEGEPDVVMACAGDVPTQEALAAVALLRAECPEVKIRFVNVVDIMALEPPSSHPHGISDAEFDDIFTSNKPVIFAFHGYPWLIHRLTYRRCNHHNFHVKGYKEEGSTTTPFDMTVLNEIDRFHLALAAVEKIDKLAAKRAYIREMLQGKLFEHKNYIREYGEDMPEILNWKWPFS